MLSSCPLAIWRKSYSSHLCPKYASETVFWAPNANFPCPGRGAPPLGRFAPSQFSSQITFGDMEISVIFRGTRSLIMMMNVSEMACLMLVFCRHTVVYIIVLYHAQTLPPLGRIAPPHITFGDIEI